MSLRRLALATVVVAGLALAPQPSQAQTQAQMSMAADADYKKADKALNAAFKALRAELNKKEGAALVKAELAWIAYRDAHCTFEVMGYEGGTIQPMLYAVCLTRMTEARTRELRDALKAKTDG